MPTIYKSISTFIDNVKKSTNKATYRAMNAATSKTNTKLKRSLSRQLGLKSKEVSRRLKVKKANANSLTSFISVGVKYNIPLSLFSPRVKIIRRGKRKYNGVSVKLPGQGRVVVPKAFLYTAPSGKLIVLARTSEKRKPIKSQQFAGFKALAEEQKNILQPQLVEEFKTQFENYIKK